MRNRVRRPPSRLGGVLPIAASRTSYGDPRPQSADAASSVCHRRKRIDYEDSESVDAWLRIQGLHSLGLPDEVMAGVRLRMAAGAGGFPLIGTADDIASKLAMLSDSGVDGVLLTWVDYGDGLASFTRDVLPDLEARGLRKPFSSTPQGSQDL